jgi:hypothetical protein
MALGRAKANQFKPGVSLQQLDKALSYHTGRAQYGDGDTSLCIHESCFLLFGNYYDCCINGT